MSGQVTGKETSGSGVSSYSVDWSILGGWMQERIEEKKRILDRQKKII